jgi:hypothetical protein
MTKGMIYRYIDMILKILVNLKTTVDNQNWQRLRIGLNPSDRSHHSV